MTVKNSRKSSSPLSVISSEFSSSSPELVVSGSKGVVDKPLFGIVSEEVNKLAVLSAGLGTGEVYVDGEGAAEELFTVSLEGMAASLLCDKPALTIKNHKRRTVSY